MIFRFASLKFMKGFGGGFVDCTNIGVQYQYADVVWAFSAPAMARKSTSCWISMRGNECCRLRKVTGWSCGQCRWGWWRG